MILNFNFVFYGLGFDVFNNRYFFMFKGDVRGSFYYYCGYIVFVLFYSLKIYRKVNRISFYLFSLNFLIFLFYRNIILILWRWVIGLLGETYFFWM